MDIIAPGVILLPSNEILCEKVALLHQQLVVDLRHVSDEKLLQRIIQTLSIAATMSNAYPVHIPCGEPAVTVRKREWRKKEAGKGAYSTMVIPWHFCIVTTLRISSRRLDHASSNTTICGESIIVQGLVVALLQVL